jgi:outer membrane protein
MSHFRLLPTLVFCAAGLFFSSAAVAQTKIGVINLEKALLDTAELKKAMVDLPVKYKPRQDQLDKIQREMQDLQGQLQSGKLSPAAQADAEARGQQLQRQADRLNQDLQEEVNNDRSEILQRSQSRMYEVVKKIAEEKGLDLVVTNQAAFYFKEATDITADATAGYDKAYPLK